MTDDRFTIVAEISKNYIDGEPVTRPLLAEQFESVIAINSARGYRLHSWKLSRVATQAVTLDYEAAQAAGLDSSYQPGMINETIIAVFEKADT